MTHPRIGVCSWSLRPRDPAALADACHRLDIGAVQLALVPVLEGGAWTGAAESLRRRGIRILSGMMGMAGEDYSTIESIRRSGGLRPDDTWPANRRRAGEAARLAGAAGIGLVTFHAGFLPPDSQDPRRPLMLQRLRAVADRFAAEGVDVALETGQETAGTLASILDDLDRPRVGVNFDPANMILYGMGDPVESLRTLAPRVRQVHVKDARPTETHGTWGTEVPSGRGAVDWTALLEVALAIEPPGAFVIEREAGPDRMTDIAAARDLIARHIGSGA